MRNLILVNRPGFQDPRDFESIAREILRIDGNIKVFIVSTREGPECIAPKFWRNPTLTVSMGGIEKFVPRRGRVLFGRVISRARQAELFAEHNIRAPRAVIYRPDLLFDEAEWGETLILKPDDFNLSSSGRTVSLVHTRDLNEPSRLSEPLKATLSTKTVLVQQFIPTGTHATSYRVGTFLGRAIHMMRKSAARPLPDLTNGLPEDAVADSNYENPERGEYCARELVKDAQMIAEAEHIARLFEGLPLLGIDFLKHAETGELYAAEINGGGNTWQFSSRHAEAGRTLITKDERVKQFNAWNTCARALVRKVRELAK